MPRQTHVCVSEMFPGIVYTALFSVGQHSASSDHGSQGCPTGRGRIKLLQAHSRKLRYTFSVYSEAYCISVLPGCVGCPEATQQTANSRPLSQPVLHQSGSKHTHPALPSFLRCKNCQNICYMRNSVTAPMSLSTIGYNTGICCAASVRAVPLTTVDAAGARHWDTRCAIHSKSDNSTPQLAPLKVSEAFM